jgi:hypothetical protein
VLLHFAMGSETFYDDAGQFLDDLLKAESSLPGHSPAGNGIDQSIGE